MTKKERFDQTLRYHEASVSKSMEKALQESRRRELAREREIERRKK